MPSHSTALGRQLISRIEREGQITFHDFMRAALYDAELGYYNTERLKIGPDGDYYTSSNVHPAFGQTLARAFVELWSEFAQQPLTILEVGAGTGRLASDILTAIGEEHPDIFDRLNYLIVEASKAMRLIQQQSLAAFYERVSWSRLDTLESQSLKGIIFSNELIDAMPTHQVRLKDGRLEELYVTTIASKEPGEEKSLALAWGNISTERCSEYVKSLGVELEEGQVIEVGLDGIDWFNRAASILENGFLITIDYGDTAEHLYGHDRREGTLRSFYRHRLIESPVERAGEQDITASVNFTALIEAGRSAGLELVSYERQAAFLIRCGLIDRVARIEGASGTVDDLKERLALKSLLVPGGVSDNFRVLIQRKRG